MPLSLPNKPKSNPEEYKKKNTLWGWMKHIWLCILSLTYKKKDYY